MSYVSTLIGKKSARTQRAHAQRAATSAAAAVASAVEVLEPRRLLAAISISNPTVNEGGNLVYNVSLNQAATSAVTVNFNLAGGTAKVGRDYVAKKPGKLTFAAGQTSKNIVIKTKDNNLFSTDKTLKVKLVAPTSGNTLKKAVGTGKIVNTDDAPVILVNNARTTEGNNGNKLLTFRVRMIGAAENPVKIVYNTKDATAISKGALADYNAAKGTLTFAKPGAQQVKVVIRGDKRPEANEAFYFNVKTAKGTVATLPDLGYAVGAIVNDDGGNVASGITVTALPPVVSVNPGTTAGVTLRLNEISADPVTVNFSTADGTATAGADYTPVSDSITFAVGEKEKVVLIPTLPGSDGGSFAFNVTSATNAALANSGATVTITNTPLPSLSVDDVSVAEGNAGSKTVTFTVSLSAASAQPISVGYTFAGVSATAGEDFTAANGTLSFAPGQTTRTITAQVLGDTAVETDETFIVTLGQPVNAPIAKSVGTATIINDDSDPGPGPVTNVNLVVDQSQSGWAFNTTGPLNESARVNYRITNTGTTAASNVQMQFFLVQSGANLNTATPFATANLGSAAAGATITGTADASGGPVGQPGMQYYARVIADGVVYETIDGPPFI